MSITKHEHYLLFNGEITGESTSEILNFINANSGNLLIGIDSVGGQKNYSLFLIQVMNENADRISLAGVGGICSAAFKIFYHFKGKRFLTAGTYGMWHYSRTEISLDEHGKPSYYEHESFLRSQKQILNDSRNWAKSFMTPTEYKKYLGAKEVYFDFNRMKELFPDAIIL